MQQQHLSEGRAIVFIGASLTLIVGVLVSFMVGLLVLLGNIQKNGASISNVQLGSVPEHLSPNAAAIATNRAAPTIDPQQAQVVAEQRLENTAAAFGYDLETVNLGATTYIAACSACHGADAHGVPNLGKDLVTSEFVHSLSDAEFLNFIKMGRPIWDAANTTGIDMPPKGGNPALTDEQLLAIIAYLRTVSGNPGVVGAAENPPAPTTQPTVVAANPTVVETQPPPSASNTSVAPVADESSLLVSDDGQQFFIAACSACHGADAHGVPNLGKDLVESEFVHSMSDAELLNFIKMGRPIWDPANTTGIDMPPKGGNPALTDEQILAIIAYIRSIN